MSSRRRSRFRCLAFVLGVGVCLGASCCPTPQTPTTPLPPPQCSELPAPAAPSARVAAALFEINDIARWADRAAHAPAPPPMDEVVRRTRVVAEAVFIAERAAADARDYLAAAEARLLLVDLALDLSALGASLSSRELESLLDENERVLVRPADDPEAHRITVLLGLSRSSSNLEEVALSVAEREVTASSDPLVRASALCVAARVEAYLDFQDLARLLEEDAVTGRIDAQRGERDRPERTQQLIEDQRSAAQQAMNGCRRGPEQALEAVESIFRLPAEASDVEELQAIAGEVIERCRAAAE